MKRIIPILLILLTLGNAVETLAFGDAPKTVTINTNHRVIGHVYYDGYIIENEKIISDIGVGYCLEVEKDYPSGQKYKVEGMPSVELNRILANGYPNLSPAELGLDNDNDAYTATQLALWSVYEGYDVYKIKSENPKLLKAIINIYENTKDYSRQVVQTNTMEYYYNNGLQRVVLFIKDLQVQPPGPEVPIIPEPPVTPEPPLVEIPPVIPEGPISPINPQEPGGK